MVWKMFQSRLITDNTSATPARTNEPFSPTTSEGGRMDFFDFFFSPEENELLLSQYPYCCSMKAEFHSELFW